MNNLTEFQREYFRQLREEEKEELQKNAELISKFKDFMMKKGVCLNESNFKYCQTIGIIATYPNIVSNLDKSLINDKEGLMDFDTLISNFERKFFANGYLYGENFMLMAHPFFRRSFHEINNYAPRFIERYWNFNKQNVQRYISLDTDRVRINVDNSTYMELDTWYGARFDKAITTIPDDVIKIVPPQDLEGFDISTFFADAFALDIKWSTKENIKSFQAEEFKSEKVKVIKHGQEYYPVRYIHAEFDIDKGYFRHFDGAIHFYTENEYYRRRASDFNYNRKNSNQIKTLSEKLFKFNGVIDVATWIEFTSHFYTGNPLVFEYFEGELPKYIKETLEKIELGRNN